MLVVQTLKGEGQTQSRQSYTATPGILARWPTSPNIIFQETQKDIDQILSSYIRYHLSVRRGIKKVKPLKRILKSKSFDTSSENYPEQSFHPTGRYDSKVWETGMCLFGFCMIASQGIYSKLYFELNIFYVFLVELNTLFPHWQAKFKTNHSQEYTTLPPKPFNKFIFKNQLASLMV